MSKTSDDVRELLADWSEWELELLWRYGLFEGEPPSKWRSPITQSHFLRGPADAPRCEVTGTIRRKLLFLSGVMPLTRRLRRDHVYLFVSLVPRHGVAAVLALLRVLAGGASGPGRARGRQGDQQCQHAGHGFIPATRGSPLERFVSLALPGAPP